MQLVVATVHDFKPFAANVVFTILQYSGSLPADTLNVNLEFGVLIMKSNGSLGSLIGRLRIN